jgi:PST family polysaccharide transporter
VPVKAIGIYSAADKLKSVSQSVISPFQQAIFPNLSSHINVFDDYLKHLKKYGIMFFGIGVCISLGLAILSRPIIHLLLGPKFDESFNALLLMSPLPAIITLAVIFGQWGLVNIGESKKLSKIYVIGSATHILHIFITIKYFGLYGAIISTLITETLITLTMIVTFFYEVKKRKINVM